MLVKNVLICQLASLAAASPLVPGSFGFGSWLAKIGGASWDMEGYAKDNPIGPTTGGAGGKEVRVSTAEDLVAAATGDGPAVIYIKGDISLSERLNIASDKTLIGVGKSAHIHENGLNVRDVDNVIIRNLKVSKIEDNDGITLWNATRVWVDHNEFFSDITKGPDFYVSPRLSPLYPSLQSPP